MRYIFFLVLLVGLLTGTVTAQDGSTNISDDTFELICSTGESIIGGIKFTFVNVNPGFYYRVSAIGINGFDPVIAVSTAPGYGNCDDDSTYLEGSYVWVSDTGYVEADARAAQVEINTGRGGNIDVLVGGYAGSSGQFAMVVEGLLIEPATDADGFLVSVPSVVQDLPMGVYMLPISGGGVDPYITGYYGDGLQGYTLDYDATEVFMWCDDAGTGDCSAGDVSGGGFTLTNGFTYEGTYYSAGLNVTPNSTNRLLYVFSSAGGNTEGEYGLVITGNAPGYLAETVAEETGEEAAEEEAETETEEESEEEISEEFAIDLGDCEPVPVVIGEVSSEYDSRYEANGLLDENPLTGWSSTDEDEEPYVLLEFGTPTTISGLLLNPYPAGGDQFADDAIQDFYVSIEDEDEEETVLLEATAEQSADYQAFYFDEPVTTESLYLIFTSNYGGSFYEASDIILCE